MLAAASVLFDGSVLDSLLAAGASPPSASLAGASGIVVQMKCVVGVQRSPSALHPTTNSHC